MASNRQMAQGAVAAFRAWVDGLLAMPVPPAPSEEYKLVSTAELDSRVRAMRSVADIADDLLANCDDASEAAAMDFIVEAVGGLVGFIIADRHQGLCQTCLTRAGQMLSASGWESGRGYLTKNKGSATTVAGHA